MIPNSEYTKLVAQILSTAQNQIIGLSRGGIVMEGGVIESPVNQAAAAPKPQVLPGITTGFVWGVKSKREIPGVNKDLIECATLALTRFTTVDYFLYDGIRTVEEQRSHVKNGTSKTMASKHLDGLAVDLVPLIGGVPKWDWNGCYQIACAMDKAATILGIAHRITWGGAWDRTLADYGGDALEYARVVEQYRQRHPGPDFIDGPHFEIKP